MDGSPVTNRYDQTGLETLFEPELNRDANVTRINDEQLRRTLNVRKESQKAWSGTT